ncbi:hypothetical protein MKD52_04115 [Helicobacter sp. CaF467b]|uniref:hypothetical protein n=1 Tax=Helicobacter sp. CaF467b TaxID=2919923 RepID=UPI001F59AC04|nr:hypothetical protein [Helicobacter sp. CaF467b]MCI2236012.1 hypothetical protein [Helicobacter sp. CaF467b]
MLKENYDLTTIISAVVTFLIVLLAIRFILFIVNRKGSQIQKPDWLEGDERFEVKKRKKGQ